MKKTLLYFSAFLFAASMLAQDTPCTATSISANTGCNAGDNTGMTADGMLPSCWGSESESVWYSVTATNDTLTFSTDYAGNTLTDTQIAIWSSSNNTCSGTFTEVGCDDDGGVICALCSEVTLTGLTVGDTYFIQIDGFGAATGTFCVSVTEPLSTAPDYGTSCELASQLYVDDACFDDIANGNNGNGNNLTSTNSIDQSCTAADDSNDNGYWSTFTANDNSTTIDMVDFTGPNTSNFFDVSVYTGTCGSLTEIDCRSVASKSNDYAIATTPGTTYYIFVTNGSNYSGEIRRLSICSSVACTAPANDDCANAIPVTDGVVYTGTNACATPDEALCSGSTENNIWYSWTAPATWPAGQSAFVSLTDQDCYTDDPTSPSSGSQLSVYNATETCATITGGTSECTVFTNPNSDENFYGEFIAVAGETYLINIDGFGGDACTFEFQVNDQPPILPITLLNFDASYNKDIDAVDLTWVTQSEINNDFFTVERTKDGKTFEVVAIVDGSGNSTAVVDYSAKDENPEKGVSYYRLKQTDYDGEYTYSRLVPVKVNTAFEHVNVMPNPVNGTGELVFESSFDGVVTIEVFDVAGKKVSFETVNTSKGVNRVTLRTNELNNGMYFLTLTNGSEISTLKFIKE